VNGYACFVDVGEVALVCSYPCLSESVLHARFEVISLPLVAPGVI
jgi:hypothetical protein